MYIIIGIVMVIVGIILGVTLMCKMVIKPSFEEIRRLREETSKHLDLYLLMNDWVHVKQKKIGLDLYFKKHGFHRIAIYGMNYVGETLVNELKGTSIDIVVGIDQNADNMSSDIQIVKKDEFHNEVDVIVVTPITYFDSITEDLEKRVTCPIVSIEDIVFEVGYQ